MNRRFFIRSRNSEIFLKTYFSEIKIQSYDGISVNSPLICFLKIIKLKTFSAPLNPESGFLMDLNSQQDQI